MQGGRGQEPVSNRVGGGGLGPGYDQAGGRGVEMIVICSSPVGAWLQRRRRWGRWPFPGCSPRPSGSGRWTWRRRRWKRRTWRRGAAAAAAAGGGCSLLHLCYEDKGGSLWSAVTMASMSYTTAWLTPPPKSNCDWSTCRLHISGYFGYQRIRSKSGRA